MLLVRRARRCMKDREKNLNLTKEVYSMIHIFNRRELITTLSDQQLYRIQSALTSANIPYRTKSNVPALSAGRYHGTPFMNSDAYHPTVTYVKASDYDHAKVAIQTVL